MGGGGGLVGGGWGVGVLCEGWFRVCPGRDITVGSSHL